MIVTVRLLRELPNPNPGFGPLLAGDYRATLLEDGRAEFGHFTFEPRDFAVLDDPARDGSEPHPFSPIGWALVRARLPRTTRQPGWIACRGPHYGGG